LTIIHNKNTKQKTKTGKQRQIIKQIRTQLPLADGTFISHSVYKLKNEDCGKMRWYNSQYRWNDEKCQNIHLYICEK
jgi:hypothetical protein